MVFSNQLADVVWIAHNCNAPNRREAYVQQLMEHIQVDSFGDCLRNRDEPIAGTRRDERWQQQKIALLSKYKFVLAFENSNIENYVTGIFFVFVFVFW